MLEQIEWFITEHFKHAPPIGTRVKIDELKTHRTGTVFCHIQGGKGDQSKLTNHHPSLHAFMYVLAEFLLFNDV